MRAALDLDKLPGLDIVVGEATAVGLARRIDPEDRQCLELFSIFFDVVLAFRVRARRQPDEPGRVGQLGLRTSNGVVERRR